MSEVSAARRIAAVVLAAGASTRLGQPKQLVRIAGEALLARVVRLAREAGCASVWVVLGAVLESCEAAVAGSGADVVVNPRWKDGMGSSIAAGVAALPRDVEAILLLVCDQPRLTVGSLRALIDGVAGKIAVARYEGALGTPALFPIRFRAELAALDGESGAKRLFQRFAAEVNPVDMPEAAFDLDTPEALAAL